MNELDPDHATFLTQLESEGFLPPESAVAAWNRTVRTSLPLSRSGRSEVPEPPVGEFETFTTEYWSLDPIARRARWSELSERYSTGIIASRLKALEPGLDIPTLEPEGDPQARELASILRELFLLHTRSRSIRRHEWIAGLCNRREWIPAVRSLRSSQPRLLELDSATAWWIEDVPTPPFEWGEVLGERSHAYYENPYRKIEAPSRESNETRKKGAGIGVGVLVAFMLIRVALAVFKSDTTPTQPYRYVAPPAVMWPTVPDQREVSPIFENTKRHAELMKQLERLKQSRDLTPFTIPTRRSQR